MGACDQGGAAQPTATARRTKTTEPTLAAEACFKTPEATPSATTVLDNLQKGALTLSEFHPSFDAKVADASAGANSDFSLEMSEAEGDPSFMAFYFSIPSEWHITPGCAIPLGTDVGKISWVATLGVINSPCNQLFPIQFTMQNASVDPKDTISFLDDSGNPLKDFSKDRDGNGVADVIEKYPDSLNELFPDRVPLRRSVGITNVSRASVIVQSLIFPPSEATTRQTLVVLFQDFANVRTSTGQSVLTDQCTPFALRMTNFGKSKRGEELMRNPPAGNYTFVLTSIGLRDADGDGIENALDTCPFDANVGDPRRTGIGDADQDGLDAACDPNDLAFNSDEDHDGFLNRGDLCPLTPAPDRNVQHDADSDQIGDECDVFGNGPNVPDGPIPLSSQGVDIAIN